MAEIYDEIYTSQGWKAAWGDVGLGSDLINSASVQSERKVLNHL